MSRASERELLAEIEALKSSLVDRDVQIVDRDAQIVALSKSRTQQADRIVELEHKLSVWAKWLWGPRTETRVIEVAPTANPKQAWLPFADLLDGLQRLADAHGVQGETTIEAAGAPAATPRRAAARRRSEFPGHLPRLHSKIVVAESDRMCCGKPMEPMGAELSRELERIETAVVHVIERTKYCCRTCQMQVLTAPGPVRLIDKGLLGANWLAGIAVERFANRMPYHRLEKKHASEGPELSRTVLSRSMIELAGLLAPVRGALHQEIVKGDIAFADETSAVVQESLNGSSKTVWYWIYANRDGDQSFDYSESRDRDSPVLALKDFRGYLHDDGYCVYETALDPERVKHVACWAHARRKFDEARDKDKRLADEALHWIGKLFALDKRAKESGLTPAERHDLRQQEAPAILAGFQEWLEVRRTQVLPCSGMGQAIEYTRGRWTALCRFLEDGRLELDNNRSERALRPVAVGRKNWMILGNERGRQTAAVFYSLIGTCKARGIDPKVYLHDVALRVRSGEDPKTLTPREWQARHGAAVTERRAWVLSQLLGQTATR